jgi:hypothetical protein
LQLINFLDKLEADPLSMELGLHMARNLPVMQMPDREEDQLAMMAAYINFPPTDEQIKNIMSTVLVDSPTKDHTTMFLLGWSPVRNVLLHAYRFPIFRRMKIYDDIVKLKTGGSLVRVTFPVLQIVFSLTILN